MAKKKEQKKQNETAAPKKNKLQDFWTLCICLLAVAVVNYFMVGLPLKGLPDAGKIASVEITDYVLSDKEPITKMLTEPEDIENARNVANLPHYSLRSVDVSAEPQIEIRYHLKSRETLELIYGENFVVWNEKPFKLKQGKDSELFVKIVEGLFFLPETQINDE